ncbi:MAG: hypothetical protein AB1638_12550 [Nitrospirota bacterium]
MKIALVVIILIAAFAGVLYFGLPFLIEKETADLRSDLQDLKQRVQKIEEESQAAPLKPDADTQKIIKTVNALYQKVNSLEDSFKRGLSSLDERIKKQKTATEEGLKKQTEAIDKISRETKTITQIIMSDLAMANIREHILKVKVDLTSRNFGSAKNELNLVDEAFEKAKTAASDENKRVIEELQLTLKKAKSEIDTDLPSAISRIDLLWHETDKLLRKV